MATITSLRRKHLTLGFVYASPARCIAFGAGVGLLGRMPGTVASLVAVPLFNVFLGRLPGLVVLGVIALMFALGVWACGRAGADLGVEDHPAMVWDEIVAMFLVLAFLPDHLLAQSMGFALFRVFDIAKPGPVQWAETRYGGGLGVMLDDLIAAFLVLLCFTALKLLFGWPTWIWNSSI